MTDLTTIARLLVQVVEGDLSCLDQLIGYSQAAIERAYRQVERLLLTKAAVLRVLASLKVENFDPNTAQQWASLMRRGYIGGNVDDPPVTPIKIEYEPEFEEPISEVLSRLDELGDIVDGEIDQFELTELAMLLK